MNIRKATLQLSIGILSVLALLLAGCARSGRVSKTMAVAGTDGGPGPSEGKANIVFMRPEDKAYQLQSSVFEIRDGRPVILGIVAAGTKMLYQADPGQHLFMVIGENADFMSANVLVGKTYYARVEMRMGMWKARYALLPVSREKMDTKEFERSLSDCRWVKKTGLGDDWANNNISSIVNKQAAYYSKWAAKAESERRNLRPQDGR